MDENRISELLLASAREIPVPEGLNPEAVRKKLEQTAAELRVKKRNHRKLWQRSLTAAAMVVLCAGLIVLGRNGLRDSSSSATAEMASAEAAGGSSAADAGAVPETAAAPENQDGGSFGESEYAGGRSTEAVNVPDFESLYAQAGSYDDVREYLAGQNSAGQVSDSSEMGTEIPGESTDDGSTYILDGRTLKILTPGDDGSDAEEMELQEIRDGDVLMAAYAEGKLLRLVVGTEEDTRVLLYDLSAEGQPLLLGEGAQDGAYVDSAEENGNIWLVTELTLASPAGESTETADAAGEEVPEWLPRVNGQTVPPENIYLSSQGGSHAWVVASFSEEAPDSYARNLMIAGGDGIMMLSGGDVILQEQKTDESGNMTVVMEFRLTEEGIWPLRSGGNMIK